MQIPPINALLAATALAAAIVAAASFRFPTLVRSYAFSTLCLGLLVVGIGIIRNEPSLYVLALVSVTLKTFIIPALLMRAARRSGMAMRLTAVVRPASTYLILGVLVGVVTFAASRSPFASSADPGYLLTVAVAMFTVGFAMMVMRRDLLSQVMGFLVMENGIAAFSFAVIHDLPFLVELGFLMTLTAGIVLMGTVSSRVRELYGTESTQALRELID